MGEKVSPRICSLTTTLSEDPSISIKLRIEIAEKYINQAKKYLEKGDIIQASEKAYKCLPVA